MIRVWALCTLLAGCGTALGEGSSAVSSGDLPRATIILNDVAKGGQASGAVWFDLGTVWYLRGDLPRAVHCWRQAARLRPRDADVQHDLALARSRLPGTPPPVVESLASRVATPGELGVVGAALAAIGSLLALRWRRYPNSDVNVRLAAGFWVVGLGVGALGTFADFDSRNHPVAVVIDNEIRVRAMPEPEASERFRLPPGSEVAVEQESGDWVLVRDGRERRGWVTALSLAITGPERFPPSDPAFQEFLPAGETVPSAVPSGAR